MALEGQEKLEKEDHTQMDNMEILQLCFAAKS